MDNNEEKTYEEVMSEIKKENYDYYKNIASECEGKEKIRVDAIVEMSRFDEPLEDKNEIFIEENNCIYQLQNDIAIDTNYVNNKIDTPMYDKTIVQVAKAAKIKNTFPTKTLELRNYENLPLRGRIIFEDTQEIDMLQISNIGLRGRFKAPRVIIKGITYLDLDLDIKERGECCYLVIEPNKKDVRGKINMSEDFYNQLTSYNRNYLSFVISDGAVKLWVNGIPYYQYDYKKREERKNITIEKSDVENAYNELKTIIGGIHD